MSASYTSIKMEVTISDYIQQKIEEDLMLVVADILHQAEIRLRDKEQELRKKYAEELAKPIIEQMHKYLESTKK